MTAEVIVARKVERGSLFDDFVLKVQAAKRDGEAVLEPMLHRLNDDPLAARVRNSQIPEYTLSGLLLKKAVEDGVDGAQNLEVDVRVQERNFWYVLQTKV